VADRDRAAVDVHPVRRDAEPLLAVQRLDRERLVELPEIDVVDAEAGAFEQPRHGDDRADPHLVGLAPGDREAAEGAERLQRFAGREVGALLGDEERCPGVAEVVRPERGQPHVLG
jgi:hypothetical protein